MVAAWKRKSHTLFLVFILPDFGATVSPHVPILSILPKGLVAILDVTCEANPTFQLLEGRTIPMFVYL